MGLWSGRPERAACDAHGAGLGAGFAYTFRDPDFSASVDGLGEGARVKVLFSDVGRVVHDGVAVAGRRRRRWAGEQTRRGGAARPRQSRRHHRPYPHGPRQSIKILHPRG